MPRGVTRRRLPADWSDHRGTVASQANRGNCHDNARPCQPLTSHHQCPPDCGAAPAVKNAATARGRTAWKIRNGR